MLENNGSYLHPHFLLMLKYFIFGPDLPDGVIDQFVRGERQFMGTSGMELKNRQKMVRHLVREEKGRGVYRDFGEEYYKLGLEMIEEFEFNKFTAEYMRKAAKEAQNRR